VNSEHTAWGTRLSELRKRLGWDQTKMGSSLGVTREWISKLERGQETVSELLQIKIQALEKGETTVHIHSGADENKQLSPIEGRISRKFKRLLRAANGEANRLNWIDEQMTIHLSPPKHWQDEVVSEADQSALERMRAKSKEVEVRLGLYEPSRDQSSGHGVA
jgi:transcriptional regulator with XRE-family HTH domain